MTTETGTLLQEAVACHQQGDWQGAEHRYRQVLSVEPEQPDALHFLGLLAHQTGHTDEAMALLRQALELQPDNALYHHNFGGVLKELEQYEEALEAYRAALRLQPDYAEAHNNLGMLLAAQEQFEDALDCYDRALTLQPGYYKAMANRSEALMELGRLEEATSAAQAAALMDSNNAESQHFMGLALREAGAADAALACLRRAVELAPSYADAHESLGICLGDMGDLQAAEQCYRKALALRSEHPGTFHNLSQTIRFDSDDVLWPTFSNLALHTAQMSDEDMIFMQFTLAKISEDRGDYAQAFQHMKAGNQRKRATLDYQTGRQQRFFHGFMNCFPDARSVEPIVPGTGLKPIFIVGMPRSGTTLVEQIVASHPAVFGAGEIRTLRQCIRAELGPIADDEELPAKLAALDIQGMRNIARRYLEAIRFLANGASVVTDKLPGNMALVGLIHRIFPDAVIIHCRRDPLDTCVSCYSKLFNMGHAFSYDLCELGEFYRLYEQLMAHWHALLPQGRMLEIRYEELVEDLEGQARRLLTGCGLSWDPACLHFYETRRPVKTASLAQVRQPVYSRSVGRWKHYEAWLDPLRESLDIR